MSKYAGYALALFLGITLTVAFYEGRRLIHNTQKAWAAAQSQVSGKDVTNPRRKALIQAHEPGNSPEPAAQIRQQRSQNSVQQITNIQQARGVRSVNQGLKPGIKNLPPQARQMIRDKRKRRRERLRAEFGSAKPYEKSQPGRSDEVDPEGVQAEPVDEVLQDTAL
jgi:hypothetical protein